MDKDKILQIILCAETEELKWLNKSCVTEINRRLDKADLEASIRFSIGDKVRFYSKRHYESRTMKIDKISSKKLVGFDIVDKTLRWSVPPTMCEKIA